MNKPLVFATHNKHKLKEVKALLPGMDIVSLDDINCFEDIAETKNTLQGNAIEKADYITRKYGYNCFADDTGLEVFSLDNEPGVFSARYAGNEANAEMNMIKLLNNLKFKKNRTAQFRTVIALNLNNQQYLFEGICKGIILKEKQGKSGFGYDPIFKPIGFNQSFAEMTLKEKGNISHRGKAIKKLVSFLNSKFE
ncbi:MAG: non-canonical purine NTP diphosphatase [Lutibacter sp.]